MVARPAKKKSTSMRRAVRAAASTVYRDAILEAATAEFTVRGFTAAKMVDIAQRAGMSVGALYRYFDNKEAIFVSLMERAAETVMARLDALSPGRPSERLAAMIGINLAFIEENRGMFLIFQELIHGNKMSCAQLAEESQDVRARIMARYRAELEAGVAAGELTRDVSIDDQLSFVSGAIHGFLETWMLGGGEPGLAAKAPLINRLVLRALGGRS